VYSKRHPRSNRFAVIRTVSVVGGQPQPRTQQPLFTPGSRSPPSKQIPPPPKRETTPKSTPPTKPAKPAVSTPPTKQVMTPVTPPANPMMSPSGFSFQPMPMPSPYMMPMPMPSWQPPSWQPMQPMMPQYSPHQRGDPVDYMNRGYYNVPPPYYHM
jgi:hypothetical protein